MTDGGTSASFLILVVVDETYEGLEDKEGDDGSPEDCVGCTGGFVEL